MLSCRDIAHQASDYLDGSMSLRQRLGFILHVFMCRNCQKFLGKLRLTKDMGVMLPEQSQVEQDVVKQVLKRIQQCKTVQQEPHDP